jgi:ribonuclease HI
MSKNIGAWAYILKYKDAVKESYGNMRDSTSQMAELYAGVFALESIKDKTVPAILTSDSQYLISGITDWGNRWKQNGFRGSKGMIANKEIWERIFRVVDQFSDIRFVHVNGHSGHPENERCDALCNLAMDEILSFDDN